MPNRLARLIFRSNVTKESHKRAATAAATGVGPVFPDGHHEIEIKRNTSTGSHAYTSDASTANRQKISYNPKKHKSNNADRRIGKLAQTLSHEMYVHARNNAQRRDQGLPDLSAATEHEQMHAPAHRQGFLDASRRVFKELDNR
ncbi:MAG: hypothetical protein ACPG4N_05755, partial [Gammaproteobacteria bacterium]